MKKYLIHLIVMAVMMTAIHTAWAAPSAEDAQKVIQDTTDKMLNALTREKDNLKKNPKQVYSLVKEIVLPNFDFERMSKFVLAKNWTKASKDQQTRFANAFRDLLVRTYSTALVEAAADGVKVTYKPSKIDKNNLITLNTVVQQGGQKPITVDYAMYLLKNKWKVYNVTVGGVSLVTNYRTEFDNDIKSVGIEGLIKKIEQQNQDKS
jgi:phospholipid transport system substrate-binding protein